MTKGTPGKTPKKKGKKGSSPHAKAPSPPGEGTSRSARKRRREREQEVLRAQESGQSQSTPYADAEERLSTASGQATSTTGRVRSHSNSFSRGPTTATIPDAPDEVAGDLADNFDAAADDAPEDDYAAIRTNLTARLGYGEPSENADRPTLLQSSFLRSQGMAGLLQNMDGLRSYPSSLMPGTMVNGLTGQLDGSAMLPGGLIVATPSVISRPLRKRRINRALRKWSINPITGVAFASARGVGA